MAFSVNSAVIARLAAGMYGLQLGSNTMNEAINAANSLAVQDSPGSDGMNRLMNVLYARDFANATTTAVATTLVGNLGITGALATSSIALVKSALDAAAPADRGTVIVTIVNKLAAAEADATYGAAAHAFNVQMENALNYAKANSADVMVSSVLPTIHLSPETAAGADVVHVTGNQGLRFDVTNPDHQVKGLDLDGDGLIKANAKENSAAYLEANNAEVGAHHSGFKIVDAYARNPLDHTDSANNYLGDLDYDGTGFAGDGVSTNGNIVLGGLGADRIYGGLGNDFLAGGGVTQARFNAGTALGVNRDQLSGGRNADFAFVELSAIDQTEGAGLNYDGGETSDNKNGTQGSWVDAAGTSNDRDWVLLEASDDDEAVTVGLSDAASAITTRSGGTGGATVTGVEAVDASGNLYGFLNDMNVRVGGAATDLRIGAHTAGTENSGVGSTGQLLVDGSGSANIVVAGYDNDTVNGNAGNDILFGGSLAYLIKNQNNPNLLDDKGGLNLNVNGAGVVTDGRDQLNGGNDNDAIVFEAASGSVDGGVAFDTLFVTDYSVGRVKGATYAADNSADQAAALAALSGDQIIRLDLANGAGSQFRDYGGANRGLGAGPIEAATADQTNYVSALGARPASTVNNVEAVVATGLGVVDYKAAGTNTPELTFNNQQYVDGSVARFDVRGIDSDTVSTQKWGGYFTDANFGLFTDGTTLSNIANSNSGGSGAAAGLITNRDVGDNAIYLSKGNDTLEGRNGDDELGGGRGDDNFVFDFGDDTDIVRRQADKDNDGLWDTDAAGNFQYAQDFRADPSGVAATLLQIDFGTTDLTSANVTVGSILLTIDPGKAGAIKLNSGDLSGAHSIGAVADAVSKAFKAIDSSVTVTAVGNSLLVQDTKGRDISDVNSEGYNVFVSISNSSASTTATLNPGGQTLQENDRVLFVDYQARASNTWTDDTINQAGNQPQQMVIGTGATTVLAEGQQWRVQLQNLQPGDKVELDVNGTKISRTVGSSENTDSFMAALVSQINNETLDVFTAAGKLSAAAADVWTGSADESVLVLNQAAVGSGANTVYMSQPTVVITAANSGTSSAKWAVANTSNTSIELMGYSSGNGNINPGDVLFLGRSGQATMATKDSYSILQTAKDAGETITGKDATLVLIPTTGATGNNAGGLWQANNGDDQLIGGAGNDTLIGGTGDDRFIGSWGTDTVSGGGSSAAANGEVIRFTDSLVFQEGDFGAGTRFTVAPSASLDSKGAGTVTAVLGTKTGVTTFDGIEELRTASNTAQDALDFSGLSNSVAASTGASANRDKAVLSNTLLTNTDYNEGVLVRLTETNGGIYWAADRNGDDDTKDSGEIGSNPLAIFGIENVIGGNANDTVVMDKTQAGSNNLINLGGQQDDLTPAGANFTEGADRVEYTHAALASNLRPVITLNVESGVGVDTVTMTGGAIGKNTVTDTLTGVEELGFDAGATASGVQANIELGDVLSLAAITGGATLNFSGSAVTVGKALGGGLTDTSVANREANSLEAGGVSVTGAGLGNELAEISGFAQFERVNGSAGTDRIIVGQNIEGANSNNGAGTLFSSQDVGFDRFDAYDNTTRGYTNSQSATNQSLFTFDLGAGTNDALDYRGNTGGVAVTVDFAGTEDFVSVDTNNGGALDNRVDLAKNVERYFGANNGTTVGNVIDLSMATEASTVTYGYEASASTNEYKDPNGSTTTDSVTGIRVGSATTPTAALFMNASALNGVSASFWNKVQGTDFADTVVFSAYQDRNANEDLTLRGGSNTVDYTNAVVAGKSDSYTLTVSGFSVTKDATTTHSGYTVAHTSTDDAVTDTDTISITRQYSAAGAALDGSLLVIGSTNSNDTVQFSGGIAAPTAATGVTGFKFGTTTVRDEVTNWTDITGNTGGGYHKIDLGSGAGVTTGNVTQDVSLGLVGGETDGAGAASNPVFNGNVVTSIKGFERITGSGWSDRLFGNDSDNVIDAGNGNDLVQGRGGADTITLGKGNDRLIYTGSGDSGHLNTPVQPQNIATGFDTITDFDQLDNDLLVIDRAAGWGSLLGTTVAIGAVGAATFTTAGSTGMILFNDADLIPSAGATNMATVAAALGASATIGGAGVALGTQTIFALDATDRVGVYVWTASTALDTTINSNELTLLTVLDDDTIGAVDAAQTLSLSDIAMRSSATGGQQLNQQLVAGVRNEIVYSSLAQSQYGAIDSFGSIAGANGFVSGEDKIDLSAFNLGAQGALALNAIITLDRTGPGNAITDANANSFFVDGGGVRRAVVVEHDGDDLDPGAGTLTRARMFVDLDGDGNLDTTKDLIIDFSRDNATVVGVGTEFPVYGDIIFGG